jgi:ABC-2 type transport system permease protein/oleandomycin transport system permease protein
LSWVFAFIGLSVRDPETAQAASFPILAPLVFASSAFVPVSTMPGWLQPWAEHQPVSVVVNAARALTAGPETLQPGQTTTRLVLTAIAWIVAIVLVFAPLAVRRYRRVA